MHLDTAVLSLAQMLITDAMMDDLAATPLPLCTRTDTTVSGLSPSVARVRVSINNGVGNNDIKYSK